MCSPYGPSLPLGWQLRRLAESQILPFARVVVSVRLLNVVVDLEAAQFSGGSQFICPEPEHEYDTLDWRHANPSALPRHRWNDDRRFGDGSKE